MTDDESKQNPRPKTAPWGSRDSKMRQVITNEYVPEKTAGDLKKRRL